MDYVEPDICLTSDGVPICMHDWELSLTTDVASRPEFASKKTTVSLLSGNFTGWFTNNFTLAEIKTLRVNQRLKNRDTYYNGLFQVPTLSEAIDMVTKLNKKLGLNVGMYIEPKHPAYFESMGLRYDEVLMQVLRDHKFNITHQDGPLSKLFIECFESTQLQRLRPKMDLPFVQLIKDPWEIQDDTGERYEAMMSVAGMSKIATYSQGIGPVKNYLEPQNRAYVALLGPDTLVGAAAVGQAHMLGMVVHPWTLRNAWEDSYIDVFFGGSEEAQLRYLYDIGVDGIFTESAAAAACVRTEYERSFIPPAPFAPVIKYVSPNLALMVCIPLLIAVACFILGTAFGRYAIPSNSKIDEQHTALLQ